MKHIKTWRERVNEGDSIYAKATALEAEVVELRAYIAEIEPQSILDRRKGGPGTVQVVFVGQARKDRVGDHSWQPTESNTFVELAVDGKEFHVDMGTRHSYDGETGKEVRGLHIFLPPGARIRKESINTVSIDVTEEPGWDSCAISRILFGPPYKQKLF